MSLVGGGGRGGALEVVLKFKGLYKECCSALVSYPILHAACEGGSCDGEVGGGGGRSVGVVTCGRDCKVFVSVWCSVV